MSEGPPTRRLFCFGLGYTALRLAETLIADGWQVAGTSRSAESCADLTARGIATYRFDRDHALVNAGALIGGATHLMSSVPPDGAGDPVLDAHAAEE